MTDLRETLAVLERGRAIISVREQWTQKAWTKEALPSVRTLRHPFGTRPVPVSYCALGVIRYVVGVEMQMQTSLREVAGWGKSAHPATHVLAEVSMFYFGVDPMNVNDGYGDQTLSVLGDPYENVLFIYDKAIASVTQILNESHTQFHTQIEEVDLVSL